MSTSVHAANSLPYCIDHAPTGTQHYVRFDELTDSDLPELRDPDEWGKSRYSDAWQQYAATYRSPDKTNLTLKLQFRFGPTRSILGLLYMGSLSAGHYLCNSLLETAPSCRGGKNSMTSRPYGGIGTVLVARLVVESIMLGGGRVRVSPAPPKREFPGAGDFYVRLGFTPFLKTHALEMNEPKTIELLNSALCCVQPN